MLNVLYVLLFSFLVLGDNMQQNSIETINGKILFVVSNAAYYGESDIPTANHFSELVFPYDELTNAGYQVDFVSPDGGAVPLGYFDTSDKLIQQYLYDCDFMMKLKETHPPGNINANEFDAIYYGGGGAAMFGVVDNEEIQAIAMHIYEKNQGVVSAVCHGSLGIANLKKADGEYLIKGKKVNGFPDLFEKKEAKYFQTFDHSVEELLKKRGGEFNFSENGWDGFFQVDGRLITGQDPTAARKVATKIIETLEAKK